MYILPWAYCDIVLSLSYCRVFGMSAFKVPIVSSASAIDHPPYLATTNHIVGNVRYGPWLGWRLLIALLQSVTSNGMLCQLDMNMDIHFGIP